MERKAKITRKGENLFKVEMTGFNWTDDRQLYPALQEIQDMGRVIMGCLRFTGGWNNRYLVTTMEKGK